jgi:predicted small lipoprotein YifL
VRFAAVEFEGPFGVSVLAGVPFLPAKTGIQNGVPTCVGTGGILRAALLLGALALGLSACGRAGPLELPPGPAAGNTPASPQLTAADGSAAPGTAQDTALKTGFDSQGNPVATPGKKRSFILDPLLQ